MKILHVVQGFPPAAGGTEQAFAHLSEFLVKQFTDEVSVFTTNCYGGDAFNRFGLPTMAAGHEVINGVRVRRFKVTRWVSWLMRIPQAIAYRLKLPGSQYLQTLYQGPLMVGLAKAIRESDAELVVASSFPLLHMYQAGRAARRSGKALILVGGLHPEDKWSFARAMIMRAYHRADACIAYTDYEADYLRNLGIPDEKIFTIGLGVETKPQPIESIAEIRRRFNLTSGPVVGYIGQLSAHKGVDLLLEAMLVVWHKHPDAQLLIAGAKRPYAAKIEKIIEELPTECQRQIKICYDFKDDEKPVLYAALDIFVYPSRYESFGISFLEAWQAHRPVVGLRTGGIPSVVDDGNDGLLTEPGHPIALSAAILCLIEDPLFAAALAENGYNKVQNAYTWQYIAQQFQAVYVQVVTQRERYGKSG